jgi:hypothetical protein
MPTPRPFGTGPYGTGPWSVYKGQIWTAGALASIATAARAVPQRIIHAAAAPLLTMTARASAAMVHQIGCTSGLNYDARATLAYVHVVGGGSVTLTLQAQAVLNWTWPAIAPCEAGTWARVA